jgi:hypothetical protein
LPLYTELPRASVPGNRASGIPFFWETLTKQRAGTTTPAPALVCYFGCYVSRDLSRSAELYLDVVVEALAILAEVDIVIVIVIVAVAVFVEF